ncbi:hypothetical protein, partial [Cobetia amphilecti]|uniref:hypothetical protein n=1 Tax=Cobetia amphilecti TaxID=1055104 RepID=UPI00329A11BC
STGRGAFRFRSVALYLVVQGGSGVTDQVLRRAHSRSTHAFQPPYSLMSVIGTPLSAVTEQMKPATQREGGREWKSVKNSHHESPPLVQEPNG